jgi:phosphoribulokinase
VSLRHPIIAVTGSSGAGTTTVRETFSHIFKREQIAATFIEGDAFHRYDRVAMRAAMAEAASRGNNHFSHFSPDANLLEELESIFEEYGRTGGGRTRHYVHDDDEAKLYGAPPGTFTRWTEFPPATDVLFYEGLHGAVITDRVNLARYVDLKIGVVPVINLEWIQKIHRDRSARGYSKEAVMDTILRRMPDYVHYICPQFAETDINFQRDESMVVIRFRNPRGIDFPYLVAMLHNSFMSRANSIVIPGNKVDLAMQLILTPMILSLVERRRRAI